MGCSAKRLTKDERTLLRHEGFNPKYFLRLAKAAEHYEFVEVQTGKVLTLRY